jgi:hypothetical protein
MAAESVRIVGRLRLHHALVLIGLSRGACAVVELDELHVKARETAQRPRIALCVGRALRELTALCIGGHTLLQMDEPLVERFKQPADDVAAAKSLDGRPLCLGLAWRAGLPTWLQLFGADEPDPAFLLGPEGERPLAKAMGERDAPLRPVAMDKVVLDALPVGKSRLDLIGNGEGLVADGALRVTLLWERAWCHRARR